MDAITADVADEQSYTKNGMRFTYRRYADDRVTAALTRADDGTVLVR